MLKQTLTRKVPLKIQREPAFQALLDLVKQARPFNTIQLRSYLKQRIRETEEVLRAHTRSGATGVKLVRDKTIELESLRQCIELVKKYLL